MLNIIEQVVGGEVRFGHPPPLSQAEKCSPIQNRAVANKIVLLVLCSTRCVVLTPKIIGKIMK